MKKRFLSHIIVFTICLIILSLPFLGRNNTIEEYSVLDHLFFKRGLTSSIVIIIFFIINYYVFIPKFYIKKKYFIYFSFIFIGLILTYFIPTLIVSSEEILEVVKQLYPNNFKGHRSKHFLEKVFLDRNAYPFYLSFIIAIVLRTHNQLQEMENLRVKSELSYLKAQINPHFLFNTLNSIYALALMKSDKTPKAILKISSLMRYVVTESEKEWIPIQQEIQYIKDYIELQQLRLNETTNINFLYNIDNQNYSIAPMLLMPFIENAFKYGVAPGISSEITIFINIKDNILDFECKNRILDIDVSTIEKTGTGILNTSKRLEAIYNNKYILDIQTVEDTFSVSLKLNE